MVHLPKEEMIAIAERAKALRLHHNLTQAGLATRSGVSWGSIKRFESTGKISLESLLKLAFTLDAMEEFTALFPIKSTTPVQSLDALLKTSKQRKRGGKS